MRFFAIMLLHLLSFANAQLSCRQVDPAGEPCGVRGNIKKGQSRDEMANPSAATSVDACRDLCVRRGLGRYSGCKQFSFDSTADVCHLFGNDNAIKPNDTSSKVYFSRKCFKCNDECSAAITDPSFNLIDNGGFEASDTYIGPWLAAVGDGYTPDIEIRPSHPGVKSRNAIRAGHDLFFNQDYRQCAGQVHRAEFDLYNVIPNLAIGLAANIGNFASRGVSFALSAPPARPAKKVVGFYTPTDTSGTIDMSAQTFGSGGGFNFDNVVVRPVNYSAAKEIGQETVINGGFEMGTAPWNYTARVGSRDVGVFELVSPGLEGTSHALRFHVKNPKNAFDVTLVLTPQIRNNTIRMGKLHRLRFITKPPLTMTLEFSDGTEIYASSVQDQYFYTDNGMLPFSIVIQDYNNDDGFLQNVLFDELSIKEIEDEN